MPKYKIKATVTQRFLLQIEADTQEEAEGVVTDALWGCGDDVSDIIEFIADNELPDHQVDIDGVALVEGDE
jgi:hypothetical protein